MIAMGGGSCAAPTAWFSCASFLSPPPRKNSELGASPTQPKLYLGVAGFPPPQAKPSTDPWEGLSKKMQHL